MIVHTYGIVCDLKKIEKISKKYNLHIIEDCAEALGSKYNKKYLGNFGTVPLLVFS